MNTLDSALEHRCSPTEALLKRSKGKCVYHLDFCIICLNDLMLLDLRETCEAEIKAESIIGEVIPGDQIASNNNKKLLSRCSTITTDNDDNDNNLIETGQNNNIMLVNGGTKMMDNTTSTSTTTQGDQPITTYIDIHEELNLAKNNNSDEIESMTTTNMKQPTEINGIEDEKKEKNQNFVLDPFINYHN